MRDLQERSMWSSFTVNVTPDKSLGLTFAKPDGLAVIKSVVSGEQCDITGQVRPGDKVVRVDNTVINTPQDIELVMRRKRFERTVTLKLVTKDKRQGRPTTRGGQRRGLAMKVLSRITRFKRLGLQHTHTHMYPFFQIRSTVKLAADSGENAERAQYVPPPRSTTERRIHPDDQARPLPSGVVTDTGNWSGLLG